MANAPRTPPGLGTSGKKLWRSVVAEFDLQVHEEILLLEALGALTGSTDWPKRHRKAP